MAAILRGDIRWADLDPVQARLFVTAQINQIRVLAAERMGECIARASDQEMARVIEGLLEIIA